MKNDPRNHTKRTEADINALLTAEIDGDRLTEAEIIANCIVTMVGGQETTTNLIGNGVLTLLCHPDELERLRNDLTLIPSAIEELLRYESPSQHTARICPEDTELGGKKIRKGQAVIAVMGAGNRARNAFLIPTGSILVAQTIAIWRSAGPAISVLGRRSRALKASLSAAIARRMSNLKLESGPLVWRDKLGLRGLTSLRVTFDEAKPMSPASPGQRPAPIARVGNGCPFHGSA